MDRIPHHCIIRRILVSPSEIHFLRFIIEAYEGIGVVTTLDPALGLLQLSIAPGCEDIMERILEEEGPGVNLRHLTNSLRQADTRVASERQIPL